jgi:hypothetical protein
LTQVELTSRHYSPRKVCPHKVDPEVKRLRSGIRVVVKIKLNETGRVVNQHSVEMGYGHNCLNDVAARVFLESQVRSI